MKIDLNVYCSLVKVDFRYGTATVELDNVEVSDVLNEIDIADAITHYDADELLNEIGVGQCIKHFGIEEVLNEIGRDKIFAHFGITEE